MIQNNNNTDFVWISPLDDTYNARFRTGGCGLDFYTGGGNDSGTLALQLDTSGNVGVKGSPLTVHMHLMLLAILTFRENYIKME